MISVRYADADYWDARYQREPAQFEWFFGHTALRRILRAYVSKKKPVLHVGCGTSNLQEGMAKSGYTVVNTDISEIVIRAMQARHACYSNMSYQVSDCRAMPEFRDCQFGSVIDKGTVDALLCCKQGTDNVMSMLQEIHRVLQPGGVFLLITLGDPARRLPLLCHPALNWGVSLLLLPKIPASSQAYVDGAPINDSIKPIDSEGPFDVIDKDTVVGLPPGLQISSYFFAYVCKRQPLQLQAQGPRGQLPNGWVAGSKELFSKLQKELGLPEDLLAKGRRKRVVHVPSGSTAAAAAAAAAGLHSRRPSAPASGGSSGSSGAARGPAAQAPAAAAAAASSHEQPQQHEQQRCSSGSSPLPPPMVPPCTPGVPRPQSAPNLALLARAPPAAAAAAAAAPPVPSALAACAPAAAAARALPLPPFAGHDTLPCAGTALAAMQLTGGGAGSSSGQPPVAAVPARGTVSSGHPPLLAPLRELEQLQEQPLDDSEQQLQWALLQRPPSAAPVVRQQPRAGGADRVPLVRRFSTETGLQGLGAHALQPHLALLRRHQAQHIERATDGLLLHDVPAGGNAAAAAAAVASVASWGQARPQRDRRLSAVSAVSSVSVLSSTSISECEEFDGLDGWQQQQQQQQQEPQPAQQQQQEQQQQAEMTHEPLSQQLQEPLQLQLEQA